jgi:hypothetical protein
MHLHGAFLLLLVAVVGCDSGPKIVPVSGSLAHKGKPVANAYIDFVPENGGRPSWGLTDEEGYFKLNYDRDHDGAIAGKHQVSIRPRPSTVKEQEAIMKGKKMPQSKEMAAFFDKYSAKNSTVEVVIDKNATDLKLDWD